jgi:hypothetical protein
MSSFHRIVLATLPALLCINHAAAQVNTPQRLRAFARLPDWTGVWERFNIGASDAPDDPRERAQFVKAFDDLHPPYNAEWEAKAQAAAQRGGQSLTTPQASCHALGFPMAMMFPSEMIQVIVTPEETTLMFYGGGARHVATDGRPHPPVEERWATPWGDSVGRWEGRVLTVDTVAITPPMFAAYGVPASLSDQVHVTERIRALDKNTLEDLISIDDPVALAHPWVLTIQYHHVSDMPHIVDRDCAENERNPVVDGKFTIAPPKP